MSLVHKWGMIIACFFALAALISASAYNPRENNLSLIRMGAGHQNQEYFKWGSDLVDFLNDYDEFKNHSPPLRFEVVLTNGALDNLYRLNRDEVDMAIVSTDSIALASDPMQKKLDRLVILHTLYQEKMFLVFRKGEFLDREKGWEKDRDMVRKLFGKKRVNIGHTLYPHVAKAMVHGYDVIHPHWYAERFFDRLNIGFSLNCRYSPFLHTLSESPNNSTSLAEYRIDAMVCRGSSIKSVQAALKRPGIYPMDPSFLGKNLEDILLLSHTMDKNELEKDFGFLPLGLLSRCSQDQDCKARIAGIQKRLNKLLVFNGQKNEFIHFNDPREAIEDLQALNICAIFYENTEANKEVKNSIENSFIPEFEVVLLDLPSQHPLPGAGLYMGKKTMDRLEVTLDKPFQDIITAYFKYRNIFLEGLEKDGLNY